MPFDWTEPVVKESINRLSYQWDDLALLIEADRITDAGQAELWFHYNNGTGVKLLHIAKVNLLSSPTMTQLAKRMASHSQDIPWTQVLTFITKTSMQYQRRGEPGVTLQPVSAEDLKPVFYIEPVILKGVPNVIFGEKGVNKTTLALTMLGLLQIGFNESPCGLIPSCSAKIAMLDWEGTQDLTNYTIARLIEGETLPYFELNYLRCKQPLADDISRIANFLHDSQTEIVLIDSLGQAAGSDRYDSAGKASALHFFECLRQLNLTSLIIGQTAKSEEGKKTIYGCHSEDTEVLTDKGRKRHPDITLDDKVACLEFQFHTPILRWEKPLKVWEYEFSGNMVNIKTASTDILVTPNHNLLIKPLTGVGIKDYNQFQKWVFTEASAIPTSFRVIHSASLKERGKHSGRKPQYFKPGMKCKRLPMNEWLHFLGYWISEGSIHPISNLVSLTQTEGEILDKMRWTLDNLGFIYSDRIHTPAEKRLAWQGNRKVCHTLTLKNNCGEKQNNNRFGDGTRRKAKGVRKLLAQWLIDSCGRNKYIKHLPALAWTLNRKQMIILLDALLEGDGSQIDEYNFNYYTASPQLADDVQKLAILIGYSTILRSRIRNNKFLVYEVGITKKSRHLTIQRRKHITDIPYSGKVYCLTTPTGAYLTRRNGKTAIQGNSTFFTYYSRNIMELKSKSDDLNENQSHLALFHHETNYTRKSPPLGFCVNYTDTTIKIESEPVSLSQFLERASQTKALMEFLQDGGKSVSAIAKEFEMSDKRIKDLLRRCSKRKLVQELGSGIWGLALADNMGNNSYM